jgi:hypothetical protein
MSQAPQPTSAQALAQAAAAAAETPAGRSVFDDLLERNFSKPEVLEVAMASKEMDRIWEKATIYAKSDFIPDHFKNRPNNCFIAVEIATRLRMSELMVMQNLGVVHGKLGFAGQFVIGAINAAKIFDDRLRFQIQAANAAGNLVDNSDASAFDKTFTIRAYALTKGKAVVGPWIDWNVVASEGWDVDKPRRDGGGTIKSKVEHHARPHVPLPGGVLVRPHRLPRGPFGPADRRGNRGRGRPGGDAAQRAAARPHGYEGGGTPAGTASGTNPRPTPSGAGTRPAGGPPAGTTITRG